MVEILAKYGGWPVVKGDDWNSDDWNWLEASQRISRDALPDLIVSLSIDYDLRNTSKRILNVSIPILKLIQ